MRTVIIDLQIIVHFTFLISGQFLAGLLADVWADFRAAVRCYSCCDLWAIPAPVLERLG